METKKEFLNFDDVFESFINICKDAIDDDEMCKYESEMEDYVYELTRNTVHNMEIYVHKKDTHMCGNFCNIREDWEDTIGFVKSNIIPWGRFDDMVKSVDDGTISDDDLKKVQEWCLDWFFTAFGTWGIKYNFQTFIGELEYEEENYGEV